MAEREYTGYNRANKDQLPLSALPIPAKPRNNGELARKMGELSSFLHQRNLNNAIHLAIEAAQGRGTLIDYFAEMGRRFGTHTAPQEDSAAMLPFSFEGHPVRVIGQNDEPWWVLTDVCEVLEIGHAPTAAKRLDTDEKNTVVINNSNRGNPNTTIINESGLWSLVLTSRKAAARRFKKWLTSEVIPTIRKTGSYTLTQKVPQQPAALPAPQPRKPKRRPDVLFRLLKQIALDAGKSEKEAIKAAGQGVMQETGIDVLGMIGMG